MPIAYGLPGPEMAQEAREQTIQLGGCLLIEGNPNAHCRACGHDWIGVPAFVNAATGDFHELSSSLATIDEGRNSPLNELTDLDGIPRQLGASTDIGAYEFIPPPTCNPLGAATPFGQPATIQLQCADAVGAPLAYAIVGAHALVHRP